MYTYFGDILEHNIKYYQNFFNTALSATYSCSDTRVTTCQWFLHLRYWPKLISNLYIVRIYHSCCQNQKNQNRIYIAPCIPRIQRRLADGLSEVGAMIQISFYVFFESEYSVSVNNIDCYNCWAHCAVVSQMVKVG